MPSSRTASSRSTTIPGKYVERSDGVDYATSRLNMERALDDHFQATGDCVSFFPGALVSLTGHPERQAEPGVHCPAVRAHVSAAKHYGSSGAAGGRRLPGQLRIREERQAVRPAHADRNAVHRRRADRRGCRRRRDRRRQIRPHPGQVPLGYPGRQVDALPRRAGLVRQAMGRRLHSARRHGGRRPVPGGRPGPAAGDRHRLQQREHAAVQTARQQDDRRPQVELVDRAAAATTSSSSRTRRARNLCACMRRRI